MSETRDEQKRRQEDLAMDRRIQTFLTRGWCPAKTAHLPKVIRDELRRLHMRPQIKDCWRNCQKFLINTTMPVTYWEGWVTTHRIEKPGPMMRHAWLRMDDQDIDLTISDGAPLYLGYPVDTPSVIDGVVRNRVYKAIYPDAINQLNPDYEMHDRVTQVMLSMSGLA